MAPNPWSNDGWNITGQSLYVKTNGLARAEARARDAGTYFGGPRPIPRGSLPARPRVYAEVQTVRPGSPPIYRFLIPPRRDDDIRITADGSDRDVGEGNTRIWRGGGI